MARALLQLSLNLTSGGPKHWQRCWFLDEDQLQLHWWLGWFPLENHEETTGSTRQSGGEPREPNFIFLGLCYTIAKPPEGREPAVPNSPSLCLPISTLKACL